MRKLRDFKCENGHQQERLVNDDVHQVMCNQCTSFAKRQLGAPMGKGNFAHGILKKS